MMAETPKTTKSRKNGGQHDPRVHHVLTLGDEAPIMLSGNQSSPDQRPPGFGTEIPSQEEVIAQSASVKNAGHGQPAHRSKK